MNDELEDEDISPEEAAKRIAAACKDLKFASVPVFDNPFMQGSSEQAHFQVLIECDSNSMSSYYSVGSGIYEAWGKSKSAPLSIRRELSLKNYNRNSFEYQTAVAKAKEKYRPDLVDVLGCLLSDASALDHSSFEDWANEFGYDTDSRKAARTYNACVQTGVELREILGIDRFNTLRDLGSRL